MGTIAHNLEKICFFYAHIEILNISKARCRGKHPSEAVWGNWFNDTICPNDYMDDGLRYRFDRNKILMKLVFP